MRKLVAYCAAVLVAAVCLVVGLDFPIGESDVPFMLLQLIAAFLFTGLVALAPFVIVTKVAEVRGLNSAIFYVGSGLALALAADVGAASWAASSLPVGDPERLAFSEGFFRFLPSFLAAGGLGGLSYWVLGVFARPSLRQR